MLLLWLRVLWLGVDLTTVISCLGVSQLLIFVSCNVFKIVRLELTPSTHTSLLLGRFSIGYLLNTVPYSRLPYWCTSSYIVVIQNILHLFLNPDKVSITHAKAKLMVCSLRSPTLPLQYISLLSILASVLLMTHQRFGMICLMMYVRPRLSTHSEGSSKPISLHKHIHPNFRFPWSLSMALTLAMSQVYDYSFLLCLVCLESVFRWRLGTIKILLKSEIRIILSGLITQTLGVTDFLILSLDRLELN